MIKRCWRFYRENSTYFYPPTYRSAEESEENYYTIPTGMGTFPRDGFYPAETYQHPGSAKTYQHPEVFSSLTFSFYLSRFAVCKLNLLFWAVALNDERTESSHIILFNLLWTFMYHRKKSDRVWMMMMDTAILLWAGAVETEWSAKNAIKELTKWLKTADSTQNGVNPTRW